MAECSECGKQSMTFTCRYCGKKFCSEHRLPENHDCEGLDGETSEEHEEWFEDKFNEKKDDSSDQDKRPTKYRSRKKSFSKDVINTLKANYTLAIISLTALSFILQLILPQQIYFDQLVLNPEISELLLKPWTLLTVMLLHSAPFHIFANMITFYFFGMPLERIVGGKEMLKIYVISGLTASIGYVSFYNLLKIIHGEPATAGLAVGASGAVIAMVGVIAKIYPDADVLLFFVIPMKIKTAVYAFGVIESINLLFKLGGIKLPIIGMFASSAHLAGLAVGLWYGEKLQKRFKRNKGVFNPLGA